MGNRLLILIAVVFIFVLNCNTAQSQYVYTASSRFVRLQEALTPQSGHLTFYNHLDLSTSSEGYVGVQDFIAQWIVRNSMVMDYSVTDNFLLAVNANVYQDIHLLSEEASTPLDHLILSAKLGSYSFANDFFYIGFLTSVFIPVSDYNNIYGVPYTGGGTEVGFNILLSYYADNLFPRESLCFTINLGYYNYFDKDNSISHKETNPYYVSQNSSSINYGLGVKYPTETLDLFLEVWGNTFMQQPPAIAYSREDMAYATLGFKVKPISFASFTLAGDFLISGDKDETLYDDGIYSVYHIFQLPTASPKNTPDWRFVFGIQLNILPLNQLTASVDPRAVELTSENQNADIIKKLEDVRTDKTITVKKIDELTQKRKDIEKNLQLLRQILKDSSSEK
ncbi:hypothetical protein Ctha_2538 [Chloroherpeton thalassium ATCC 35110]|uniref:Uncharacterized protein n=1 Tax=Chloroherpeton thalassium (strain ATCC 35110 / GB-78) TaxID=517418 RepID=B3QXS2_CHLT3|nr:hypothetical protein [Chloroherpeton thalassium]ACF14987.1 hypothetical protein Ctha_2538 [Chloroherpeton thalassium ATCC 35110]